MLRNRFRNGLLTIQFTLTILTITVGLLGIAVYLKRALSYRWREVGDTFGYGRQYEP